MHRWSDDDNLIAYCLYRLGTNEQALGITPKAIGEVLGTGYDSLAIKVANFKAIDGDGGMSGYSQQAKEIYQRHCNLTNAELRELGIVALQKALDKYTNG
jgi:hypothetical protein